MVGWVCGGDNILLLLLLRWIRGGIGEIVSLSLRTRVYRDAAMMMMLVREMEVAQRRDTEEQGDASVESEKKATQVWWYEGDTKSVSSWFSFRCYLKKKIGSIELPEQRMCCACGDQTQEVLQKCNATMMKKEKHPPCFHESPEQRCGSSCKVKTPFKSNPAVVHQQMRKSGYPPCAKLIAE